MLRATIASPSCSSCCSTRSANPDLQNTDGHTALVLAASKANEACVQALTDCEPTGQHRAARRRCGFATALQRRGRGPHTNIAKLIRQHTAPHATQAEQAARADAAMEESVAGRGGGRAGYKGPGQARSDARKKPRRRRRIKAGRAAAAGDESSEASPAAVPAAPGTHCRAQARRIGCRAGGGGTAGGHRGRRAVGA